jgi:hypothetical protein
MNEIQLENIIINFLIENSKSLGIVDEITFQGETKLVGNEGLLSSIQLVHFLVTLEDHLNSQFNLKIIIASSKAFSQHSSPFMTIKSLSIYLSREIIT